MVHVNEASITSRTDRRPLDRENVPGITDQERLRKYFPRPVSKRVNQRRGQVRETELDAAMDDFVNAHTREVGCCQKVLKLYFGGTCGTFSC